MLLVLEENAFPLPTCHYEGCWSLSSYRCVLGELMVAFVEFTKIREIPIKVSTFLTKLSLICNLTSPNAHPWFWLLFILMKSVCLFCFMDSLFSKRYWSHNHKLIYMTKLYLTKVDTKCLSSQDSNENFEMIWY